MTARVKLHQIIRAGRSHTNVCVHGEKVRNPEKPWCKDYFRGLGFFYVLKAHNLLCTVLGSTLNYSNFGCVKGWGLSLTAKILLKDIFLQQPFSRLGTTNNMSFRSEHDLAEPGWSGSCSDTFKNTTTYWPEEDGDRGTDFRGRKNPGVWTAAIQMLWNEYKYNNYMT